MMQEYGYVNKSGRIKVFVFAALFLLSHFLLFAINLLGKTMILGDVAISGVLTAIQFVLALAMTVSDFDFGGNVASAMLLFSIMNNLIIMVKSHSLSPMPGLVYYIGSIVAVNVIRAGINKGRKISGQELFAMIKAQEDMEIIIKGAEDKLLSDAYVTLVQNSVEIYGMELKNMKFIVTPGEQQLDVLKKKEAIDRLTKVGVRVEQELQK